MARRQQQNWGRWLLLTAVSAVIGATVFETLKHRMGWRGHL